jgi:hypothetical protein
MTWKTERESDIGPVNVEAANEPEPAVPNPGLVRADNWEMRPRPPKPKGKLGYVCSQCGTNEIHHHGMCPTPAEIADLEVSDPAPEPEYRTDRMGERW